MKPGSVILRRKDAEGSQTTCIAFWDPSRCSGWRGAAHSSFILHPSSL